MLLYVRLWLCRIFESGSLKMHWEILLNFTALKFQVSLLDSGFRES